MLESKCLCNNFFGHRSPTFTNITMTTIQDVSRSLNHLLKLLQCHHVRKLTETAAKLHRHQNWALSLCAGRLQSIDISGWLESGKQCALVFWQLIVSHSSTTMKQNQGRLFVNALNGSLHNTNENINFCNCASNRPFMQWHCSICSISYCLPWHWNFMPSTETVIAGSGGIVGVYLPSAANTRISNQSLSRSEFNRMVYGIKSIYWLLYIFESVIFKQPWYFLGGSTVTQWPASSGVTDKGPKSHPNAKFEGHGAGGSPGNIGLGSNNCNPWSHQIYVK